MAYIIGSIRKHKKSRIKGPIDRLAPQPDGRLLARIKDHWFLLDELEQVDFGQ